MSGTLYSVEKGWRLTARKLVAASRWVEGPACPLAAKYGQKFVAAFLRRQFFASWSSLSTRGTFALSQSGYARSGNKCQLLPKTEEFRQMKKGVGSQPFLEIKYTQYCFLQEEAGLFQMDTITNLTVWTLFSTTS